MKLIGGIDISVSGTKSGAREGVPFKKPQAKQRPAPRKPGKARERILAFIDAELAKGRAFPDHETLRVHMGWANITSVMDCLMGLAAKGDLRRAQIQRSPSAVNSALAMRLRSA
jgi:hypothetical protein